MNLKKVVYGISTIDEAQIPESEPVFALKNGRLIGMVVNERQGWILRTGGAFGCDGYHDSRESCMRSAEKYGYEFQVDKA